MPTFRHAQMDLRVPYPLRTLQRVGSYDVTVPALFSRAAFRLPGDAKEASRHGQMDLRVPYPLRFLQRVGSHDARMPTLFSWVFVSRSGRKPQ